MRLNGKALGLAFGLIWGGAVLLATLWLVMKGVSGQASFLSHFYLGYSVSLGGSVIGLLYGFIDGFATGWILAWLYNRLAA